MYIIAPLVLALFAAGCATAEMGRYIGPADITWIKKRVTTKAEVVQRFGHPMSEVPDWTGMQFQTTSTTITTKSATTADGESQQTVTTTKMDPVNRKTKAMYLHTKSQGGLFTGIDTTQEQFWVTYDEGGIVEDYGITQSPGMNVR